MDAAFSVHNEKADLKNEVQYYLNRRSSWYSEIGPEMNYVQLQGRRRRLPWVEILPPKLLHSCESQEAPGWDRQEPSHCKKSDEEMAL